MGAYSDLYELLPASPAPALSGPPSRAGFPRETPEERSSAAARAVALKEGERGSEAVTDPEGHERDIAADKKIAAGKTATLTPVSTSSFADLYNLLPKEGEAAPQAAPAGLPSEPKPSEEELAAAAAPVTGRALKRPPSFQADVRRVDQVPGTPSPAGSVMNPAIATTARPAEEQASPVPPVSRQAYDQIAQQYDLATPEQRQAAAQRQDAVGAVYRHLLGEAAQPPALSTAESRVAGTRLADRAGRAARAGAGEATARAVGISQILAGLPPQGLEGASEGPPEVSQATQKWRDYEAGVVGSTGATLAYAGRKAGIGELAELGDAMDAWAAGKMPPAPTFADQVVQGFGSMGSFLIPGLGVMKGARALAILSPALSKWAGAGAMAGLEAAAEADGTYKSLVGQGKTEQEAMAAADKAFTANLLLIGITDKLAFFNDLKKFGARIGAASATEGPGQEAPQQMIQNYLTGRPIGEGVGTATAVGSIVGGGVAATQGVAASALQRDVVQQGKAAGLEVGVAAEVARENAMAKLEGGLEIRGQPPQGAIPTRTEPTLGGAPPQEPPRAPDGRVEPTLTPAPESRFYGLPPFVATHTLEDGTPVTPQVQNGQPMDGLWVTAEGRPVEIELAKPIKASTPNAELELNGNTYKVEIVGPGQLDPDTARLDDGQIVPISDFRSIEPEAKLLLGIATPEEKAKLEGKPPKPAAPAAAPKPAERPVAGAKAEPAAPPPGGKPAVSAGPRRDAQGREVYPSKAAARGAAKALTQQGQRARAKKHPYLPGKFMVVDAPLSPAQVAAGLRGRARLLAANRERRTPNPEKDTLVEWIQKSGGLHIAEKLDVAGGDNPSLPGNPFLRLFTTRGERADELVRRAIEAGYITQNEANDPQGGVEVLKERIKAELAGKPSYSMNRVVDKSEEEELFETADAMGVEGAVNMNAEQLRAAIAAKQKEIDDALEVLVDEEGGASDTEVEASALVAMLPDEVVERLAIENPDATPEEWLEILRRAVKEQNDADEGAQGEAAEPLDSENAADREGAARPDDAEAARRAARQAGEREGPAGDGQEAGPEVRQPTAKYETARETANKAGRVFAKAQADYRARKIGDAEFLAAKKVHDEAQRAFDKAFAEEQERPEKPALELSTQTEAELKAKAQAEAAAAKPPKEPPPKKVTVDQPDIFNTQGTLFQPGTVDYAAQQTDTDPSAAQVEAGNYEKGKFNIAGMEISIETPAGEKRRPAWPALQDHYGYAKGTIGYDKDHLDVFVKPGTDSQWEGKLYVVNQLHPADNTFDEHKVLLGYDSVEAATTAYHRNYTQGWEGFDSIHPMSIGAFKSWAFDHTRKGPKGGPLTFKEVARREKLAEQALSETPTRSDSQQGQAAPQFDLFAAPGIPGAQATKILERVEVALETERTVNLPGGVIPGTDQAAAVFAALNTSPRERFQMLGVDATGKPVAFFELFAGTLMQTSIFPREVWLNLYMAPGVKAVYFAHNHPNGLPAPSQADTLITEQLQRMLRPGMGIEYKDHVILAGERYFSMQRGTSYPTPVPSGDLVPVPVMERKIRVSRPVQYAQGLLTPADAENFFTQFQPEATGLLLLDVQHRPMGWWPMTAVQMAGMGLTANVADTLRYIGARNPAAAIAFFPPGQDLVGAGRAMRMAAEFLAPLDIYMLDGFTLAGGAPQPLQGYWRLAQDRGTYSLAGRRQGATVERVLEALNRLPLYRAQADKIVVIQRIVDAPDHVLAQWQADGVDLRRIDGYFDPIDGRFILVADNIIPDTLEQLVAHELVGHYGVDAVLGAENWPAYSQTMLDIYRSRQGPIMTAAATGFLKHYNLDLRHKNHRVVAAREWIARMAEEGKEQTLVQKVWAMLRDALRKIGLVREWSDADLLELLRRAREELTGPNPLRAYSLLGDLFATKPQAAAKPAEPLGDIEARPGVEFGRLNALLGAKLYGEPKDIAAVSVKEMFQNSFDALKELIDDGKRTEGKIAIRIDQKARTITVEDDGAGMSAETLAGPFLRLAGTKKGTRRSSGGLGIAKGLFLYGNEHIRVETAQDGVLSILDTTGSELEASAAGAGPAPKITRQATDRPSGTKVVVKIPESYVDASTRETVQIPLGVYESSYPVLSYSPLFSNIEVTFDRGSGAPDVLPGIGKTFPKDDYSPFTQVKFKWGQATIYVSKKEMPAETKYGNNLRYLSNGLWQFSDSLLKNPFDWNSGYVPRMIYIDINPSVKPEDPGYPFDLNRQKLASQVGSDFSALLTYLSLVYRAEEAVNQSDNFGNARYFDEKGRLSKPQVLKPKRDKDFEQGLLRIVEGDQVEIREGKLVVNGRKVPILTREDLAKIKINPKDMHIEQSEIDASRPMLHENLQIDDGTGTAVNFSDLMRNPDNMGPRFDGLLFGVGRVFRALADAVAAAHPEYSAIGQYGVGVSLDPGYRGVWIDGPFKGMFVNPAAITKNLKMVIDTPELAANLVFGTMVHEIAHHRAGHGAEHVAEVQKLYATVLSSPQVDLLRKELIQLFTLDFEAVKHINEAFENGTLSAPGNSLASGDNEERIEGTTRRASSRLPGGAGLPSLRGDGRGDRAPGSSQLDRGLSPEGEARLDGRAYSLRGEPRYQQLYGVRDGRLLGMARQGYQGGVWEVFLAAGANETLFTRGQFRRLQAANQAEVLQIFATAGLETWPNIPQAIRVPEQALFEGDWTPPKDTWIGRQVILLQNRLLAPRQFEEVITAQVGPLPETAKAHREARLAHPRAAGMIVDFDHEHTERIVKLMQQHRLTLKRVGLFLYARHAAERNAAIEAINPTNLAGSGMTDERAAEILGAEMASPQAPFLEEIAGLVRGIVAFRERLLVDKGLAKRDVVELLRTRYPNYVPLKEIQEDEHIQSEIGAGFKVSKPFQRAWGRFEEANAELVLPAVIAQAKGTIAAGENAEVLRAFLRLVSFAPNPKAWTITKHVMRPYLDKLSGEVRWAPRPGELDHKFGELAISVPLNGERVIVVVKDPRLATAFKTSGLPVTKGLRMIGTLTRFYALTATALNPEFVATNLMRDFQQAVIRITGEQDLWLAAKVAKDVPLALWGAYRGLREEGQLSPQAGVWERWYRRYIEAGGHVAYRGLYSAEDQHKDLLKTLAEAGIFPQQTSGGQKLVLRAHRAAKVLQGKAMVKFIMDLNGAVENALRLAAFKNAIEAGWNDKDAAMLSRQVTVDFNLRGEAGARLGSLYMFFNANAQGTALVFRSIVGHRAMQVMMAALFLMGMGFDWWNAERSEESSIEGRKRYDDISYDIKERNFVFMDFEGTDAFTVPLPYGFNVFYNAGVNTMAVVRGVKSPFEAALDLFATAVNAFSPLGNVAKSMAGALQYIMPTVADPFVQAGTNKSFNERPIYPERPAFAAPQADAFTYFQGTPQHWVATAQWINRLGGGNDVRSGKIGPIDLDWYPNLLQHWANSTFGSAGAFVARTVGAVYGKASGEDVRVRDIPFVRRFYYEPKDVDLSRRFYENLNSAEIARLEVDSTYKRGDREGGDVLREEFQAERALFPKAREAERRVAQYRKEMAELRRQPDLDEARRKQLIEERQEKSRGVMELFNRDFAEAVK